MRNRRSLSGTITKGEKKAARKSTRTHTYNREREEEAKLGLNKLSGHSFVFLCTFIAGPLCQNVCEHAETRYRKKRIWASAVRRGTSEGGLRRRALCEVSLGYDRLVPTLAGLLTVAKRRPKTTKRDSHSNALRQGQLFGARGERRALGGQRGTAPRNNWTATCRLWLESRIDVRFFRH